MGSNWESPDGTRSTHGQHASRPFLCGMDACLAKKKSVVCETGRTHGGDERTRLRRLRHTRGWGLARSRENNGRPIMSAGGIQPANTNGLMSINCPGEHSTRPGGLYKNPRSTGIGGCHEPSATREALGPTLAAGLLGFETCMHRESE